MFWEEEKDKIKYPRTYMFERLWIDSSTRFIAHFTSFLPVCSFLRDFNKFARGQKQWAQINRQLNCTIKEIPE